MGTANKRASSKQKKATKEVTFVESAPETVLLFLVYSLMPVLLLTGVAYIWGASQNDLLGAVLFATIPGVAFASFMQKRGWVLRYTR